jgi:hypothetical protein
MVNQVHIHTENIMTKKKKKRDPEVIYNPPKGRIGEENMYIKEYFQQQGAFGGAIGSKKTAAKRTPKERSEAARNAVKARWAKYRKEKA